MKSVFARLLAVAAIMTFAFGAQAGFHLEPYTGLSVTGDYDAGNNNTGDFSVRNFGTKLGYQAASGLHFGGDIQLGVGEFSPDAAGATDDDGGLAAFGAYVGYQTAMGFRVYGTYLFRSALVVDGLINDTTFTGDGFKVGAGYSFNQFDIPWLAVNLEYHTMNYDEAESGGISGTADLDTNFVMLLVSFPFDFGRG